VPNEKPDSFQCGSFEVARNPDVRQFVDKLNRLREAVDACRLQDGVGYTVSRSTNGTVLSIKPSTGGTVVAERDHQFKVSVRTKDGQTQFRVFRESFLFWTTGGAIGPETIGGLDQWLETPLPTDVRLRVRHNNSFDFVSAVVEASNLPIYAPNETSIQLARINESKRVVQSVFSFVRARNACLNGAPAIVLDTQFVF